MKQAPRQQEPRLVALALGTTKELADPAASLARAASRLAAMAALQAVPLTAGDPPDASLHLLHGREGGWLALVPEDPGLPLEHGGSWVEALGAWRQPAVLIVTAAQLATGWPAAATALLRRWGVPLLGLVQWGGVWEPELRRRDALPWLGCLAESADANEEGGGGEGCEEDLAQLLRQRWWELASD